MLYGFTFYAGMDTFNMILERAWAVSRERLERRFPELSQSLRERRAMERRIAAEAGVSDEDVFLDVPPFYGTLVPEFVQVVSERETYPLSDVATLPRELERSFLKLWRMRVFAPRKALTRVKRACQRISGMGGEESANEGF